MRKLTPDGDWEQQEADWERGQLWLAGYFDEADAESIDEPDFCHSLAFSRVDWRRIPEEVS